MSEKEAEEGAERESDKGEETEEGELDKSFDSLAANVSVTGVPSVDTSLEAEEVDVGVDVTSLILNANAIAEEEEEEEGDDEDNDGDEEDDLGDDEETESAPPPASGDAPDNWAYAEFKLQMNVGLQFNTVNGDAAMMSVDNIDMHNANAPPPTSDRRFSEMSGYTAGSSSAASEACTARHTPRNPIPRISDATAFSTSTMSSLEAKHMVPQSMLSNKRLSYLKNKYWNHELLYYVLDFIDQVVTQVPGEEQEMSNYSQPMQVKRSSKRLTAKNPKRRKLDEVAEMPRGSKIIFAKLSKNTSKYLPAKSWNLLESGDFLVSFYGNETKRVPKCNVFEDFENNKTDRKVMFLRPNKFGKRIAIPGLVADIEHTEDGILCDLVTDEGDMTKVHISYLYMTEEALLEIDPSRKRNLPKASTADAEDTNKSTVQIPGTEEEGAIEPSSVEATLDTEDTTTQMSEQPLIGPHHILRQPSFSASSSSEDFDPLVPAIELAEGCDAEKKFFTPYLDTIIRCKYVHAHQKNCDMLGPLEPGDWFKDIPFILTCSKHCLSIAKQDVVSEDEHYPFSDTPFVFSHLVAQIKLAGGLIYEDFIDVPTEKRNDLLVIAPKPCTTARFIESIANNAKILCHEWIINCCRAKALVPHQELPLGWAIETKRFINSFDRLNLDPFANISVRITSQSRNDCFYEFWARVMSACGADVRPTRRAKFRKDLIILDGGYRYANLPIAVTPEWVIQSIIHGEARKITAHEDYEYPVVYTCQTFNRYLQIQISPELLNLDRSAEMMLNYQQMPFI